MKQITELVSKNLSKPQQAHQGTIGREELSGIDKEIINYIFYKIRITWGDAKYKSTFSDSQTLKDTKRDWAKDLLKAIKIRRGGSESDDEYAFRLKNKVDGIFQDIRYMSNEGNNKDWQWPSLKMICGYLANHSSCEAHRAFRPDRALPKPPEVIEEEKQAAREAIESLKNLF